MAQAVVSKFNLPRFKKAYHEAVDAGQEVFQFDGSDVPVSYAKYLIEYLDK